MKTCYDLGKEMTEMKYKALPIGVSDFHGLIWRADGSWHMKKLF